MLAPKDFRCGSSPQTNLRDFVEHVDEDQGECDEQHDPGSDDLDGDDEGDPGYDYKDPGGQVHVQQVLRDDPGQAELQGVHGVVAVLAHKHRGAAVHLPDGHVEVEGPLVDLVVGEAAAQDHLGVVVADCGEVGDLSKLHIYRGLLGQKLYYAFLVKSICCLPFSGRYRFFWLCVVFLTRSPFILTACELEVAGVAVERVQGEVHPLADNGEVAPVTRWDRFDARRKEKEKLVTL